ncbi:MAG TPA: hypothetical protein VNT04_09550 [Gaiellaceae bacterium]|nr:hypothetical protein [Gaiellaceae bacterium]
MAGPEELWIPLVDEPIGSIVSRIQDEHPEISRLVDTPTRLLAFRTFAYIRVGMVLGELLVEDDIEPYNGSETWVEKLLLNPKHHARVVEQVRAVALEIAADPRYEGEAPLGPDDAARSRFRDFAKRHRGSA